MAIIKANEILASSYTLASNTFTAKEDAFAAVEVGDAKQPTAFYPQVKIMRWDNEVNFSARLVHEETNPKISLVADKIQWIGDAVEAHFYEIGEGKEGGGFEFEIILKKPPKSNVISMTIQTKGLDFFYQPELTQKEIEHGAERPENVVGSYAVYHKTIAGDYTALGGKNYKAGKAFHIFRPRIEDSDGNWVWGKLNIDEKAGLLTVTIPQDFLDKAVYPVRHAAGLEFGYHTVGLSTESFNPGSAYLFYSASLPTSDGVLESVVLYCKSYHGDTVHINPAIYDNAAGSPNNRLAYHNSGAGIMPIGAFGWAETDLSYSNIIMGTRYWLGFMPDKTFSFKCDVAGNWESIRVTSSWPYPFDGSFNYDKASIYAIYEPVATGQATAKRFGGIPHMALNRGVW